MELEIKYAIICLVLMMIVYLSCKKELSCEDCAEENKPPIALAGPNQVITLPTDSILLDGRTSSDPDGIISSYHWTKISGPSSFAITKPTDSITKLKSLVAGTYQFELKVTDNGGLSAKDTLQIIVNDFAQNNRPPIADAGVDQTITLPIITVNLDGSTSSDPDNNITNYTWTKISGPESALFNPNTVQTQVNNLVPGTYQFELKVTDAEGLFSKDTLDVYVREVLAGSEIVYNGVWGCNDICADGDVYWDSSTDDGLYSDSNIALRVSLRLDTSSVWIDVHKIDSPLPPINEFYWVIDRGFLWVFAFRGSFIGTPVTIKVNFL